MVLVTTSPSFSYLLGSQNLLTRYFLFVRQPDSLNMARPDVGY